MDNRPIGIFDSGVGGLTAVRALQAAAPNESIVYFGDTARVPYGNRTKEDITRLSQQDVRFLRTHGLKAVLVACNTITTSCIDVLSAENSGIPVFGVVESAAEAAAKATKNKKVGIIATQATVRSGAYDQRLKHFLPDVQIFTESCPKLVPLIESGHIHRGDSAIEETAADYLAPIKSQDVDTMILGCTHFPLIREVVQAYMGSDLILIDSGGESVKTMLDALSKTDSLAEKNTVSLKKYFCSARLSDFEKIAKMFLLEDIHGRATEINIEAF